MRSFIQIYLKMENIFYTLHQRMLFTPGDLQNVRIRTSRMKNRINGTFIFLLFMMLTAGTRTAFALDPHKSIHQYGHSVWHRQNGLPANAVNVGFHGRDGYLWLGTSAGLFRFDGVNFKSVNTSSANNKEVETIAALCVTKDSSLWVGTAYSGLVRIKNEEVTLFDASDDSTIGLKTTQIKVLLESRAGNLWVGTSYGLYKYIDGRFFMIPIHPNFITSLAEDSLGRIWVGTHAGVRVYNDTLAKQVDSVTTSNGLPHNMISSLFCDSRGNIWIGTYGGLVFLNHKRTTTYQSVTGLPDNHITAICEDRDNNLWFGTYSGLSRFSGGKWSFFTADDGLTNNQILSIIEDYEGSLWVCTVEGLNRFMDVNITPFTVTDGLANDNLSGIAETPDSIMCFLSNVSSTITRLKNGRFSIMDNILVGTAAVTRDGSLWIGQTGILQQVKDGKITKYDTNNGLPVNWISALTEDDKSLILDIDQIGIRRFFKGRLEPYLMRDGKQYPSLEFVSFLHYQHNGTLWIGSSAGLVKIQNGISTVFSQKDGLAQNWVGSMFDDKKGDLWISSPRGGITLYKDGKFTPITFKDGLFTDEIYCILCDDDGSVWMSSPRGIGYIKRAELDDFIAGRIKSIHTQVFVTADGMKSDECFGDWQPAGWKALDGRLWFATKKGAVMIDPKTFKRNIYPPPVLIEQMVADQKLIPLDRFASLSPGKEKLEFHYTALSFLVPERVHFKYLLEGYDHEWVNAGTRRVAYYTNLPPGTYRFRVTACNNDNIWNEIGASFAFKLEPHVYQTTWFYGLLIIVIAGAGFGLYRLRMWQLLLREKELKMSVDEAVAKIKVLGGLIPICANCKKIRDDKGYWDQLERYIQEHSDAKFSHGICPDCAKIFYPDYAQSSEDTDDLLDNSED